MFPAKSSTSDDNVPDYFLTWENSPSFLRVFLECIRRRILYPYLNPLRVTRIRANNIQLDLDWFGPYFPT